MLKLEQKLKCWQQPRQRTLPDFSSGTCAAGKKALTNLSDRSSKPWVFVSFGPSQKKEPPGGGKPRQACEAGNICPSTTLRMTS